MKGRNIVVTGGRGALGEAVVAAFTARGAVVHVPGREVRFEDESHVTAYYAALPSLWASVHVVGGFAMAPIAEASLAQLQDQITTNLVTCFLACREAVKTMRKTGGGRIVNVAARAAVVPSPKLTAYVASKGAVVAFTQSLAAEVLAEGILVNAVLPGTIDTPNNRKGMPDADRATWAKPQEIAETIAFLASETNALTSGALIPIYGRS